MTLSQNELIIDYERPTLYKKQEAAIFDPKRYSWIVAGTKCGKTIGCIIWFLEEAVYLGSDAQGKNLWWVAPTIPQAKIAYDRLKLALRKLQEQNDGAEIYHSNDSDRCITLFNGAKLHFKTGERPDNLYGEDVYAVVIDEASRMREESFFALRSTLTKTKGKVRIIGNLKGRKNWFYKGYANAENMKGHAAHKIIAWDAVAAGVLDKEEIEDAERMLPEDIFRELYLCEPSDDGGNPFGLKYIHQCAIEEMSSKDPYVWGWDVARSQDWTVGIALDKDGVVCRYERFQHDWRTTLNVIADLVGDVETSVDATGVGSPVVEDLQRKCRKVEGFIFTSASKQLIMEGLAVAIQGGLIKYPKDDRLCVIVSELESFEYEYTRVGVRYSAMEGFHDDAVCALALAWKKFNEPKQTFRIRSL